MNAVRSKQHFSVILASTVLAAVIYGVVHYRRDMADIHKHIDSLGSQVIDTPCGKIEFARYGEGYPVLVIHGNGGGFDQGLGLAKGYLNPSFMVIAPSRFGYLRSPVPENATPALQADAYACLLDHLGIQRAAILTSSAGVTSSTQFALRYPERVSALVFHSPNAPGEAGLVAPPQPVFKALFHADFLFWVLTNRFSGSLLHLVGVPKDFPLTSAFQAEVDTTLRSILPPSARADGIIFDTYFSNPAINTYPLGDVAAPTLVISAVDDPMALHESARRLANQIPGADLYAVPDGGHLLLGHTDEVRAEITRFLCSHTANLQAQP